MIVRPRQGPDARLPTDRGVVERHEVISVGLQKLYLEPDRLARQDPSLLELLLKGIQ